MLKDELVQRFEMFFQNSYGQDKSEIALAYYLGWYCLSEVIGKYEQEDIIPVLPRFAADAMQHLRDSNTPQVNTFRQLYLEARGEQEIPDLTDMSNFSQAQENTISMVSHLIGKVTEDNLAEQLTSAYLYSPVGKTIPPNIQLSEPTQYQFKETFHHAWAGGYGSSFTESEMLQLIAYRNIVNTTQVKVNDEETIAGNILQFKQALQDAMQKRSGKSASQQKIRYWFMEGDIEHGGDYGFTEQQMLQSIADRKIDYDTSVSINGIWTDAEHILRFQEALKDARHYWFIDGEKIHGGVNGFTRKAMLTLIATEHVQQTTSVRFREYDWMYAEDVPELQEALRIQAARYWVELGEIEFGGEYGFTYTEMLDYIARRVVMYYMDIRTSETTPDNQRFPEFENALHNAMRYWIKREETVYGGVDGNGFTEAELLAAIAEKQILADHLIRFAHSPWIAACELPAFQTFFKRPKFQKILSKEARYWIKLGDIEFGGRYGFTEADMLAYIADHTVMFYTQVTDDPSIEWVNAEQIPAFEDVLTNATRYWFKHGERIHGGDNGFTYQAVTNLIRQKQIASDTLMCLNNSPWIAARSLPMVQF